MVLLHWFIDRVHVLEDRSLVLENVNLSDEGEYRCEAENVVGSISAVGSLIIQCKFNLECTGEFPCRIKKCYLHVTRYKNSTQNMCIHSSLSFSIVI